MAQPKMSDHFQSRKPSSIRIAQIKFLERTDGTEDVNVAIGNVVSMTRMTMDGPSPER